MDMHQDDIGPYKIDTITRLKEQLKSESLSMPRLLITGLTSCLPPPLKTGTILYINTQNIPTLPLIHQSSQYVETPYENQLSKSPLISLILLSKPNLTQPKFDAFLIF